MRFLKQKTSIFLSTFDKMSVHSKRLFPPVLHFGVPPSEKTLSGFQRAGKKKKGCGENEFLPACFARRRRAVGWEAARPCVSKEAKPAKIDSLMEKRFCARPLKNVSIFAGFVRRPRRSRFATLRGRQAASRWAGLPPEGQQSVVVFSEMSSNFFQQTPPFQIWWT
jgi:hypothetical protein